MFPPTSLNQAVYGGGGNRTRDGFPHESCNEATPARKKLVYFIQVENNGPIKIGIAANVWTRLRDLQVANPYELEVVGYVASDDASGLETFLHGAFQAHRLRGEWFKPAREITDWISDAMIAAEKAA